MDRKIHVPTPNEEEQEERTEAELDDIERSFYKDVLMAFVEHLRNYLLYIALVLLGAWLAFYYLKAYAARETGKSDG